MIAFHEGEDRPVKKQLRAWADEGLVQLETKKPIMPDEAETTANPRSRSAKMRVARKL